MRVTLVSNMYHPEQYASAPLNTEAAQYLTERGHEVTVLTSFPSYPDWSVWPEWRRRLWSNTQEGSVRLRRVRCYVPKKPGTIGRVAHYASFAAASLVGLGGLPRPDVIVCVTPPIELAYAGWLWSRLLGSKLVLWVKDLVPEIAIQLGMLRDPTAIALARRVERCAYCLADRIVVICEGFREYLAKLERVIAPVDVVPDWVDPAPFQVVEDPLVIRRRYDLPADAFVVVHSGNMGRKQGLETLLEMAAQFAPAENTVVLLVGSGTERNRLVALRESMGLRCVRFLPVLPREEFPKLLSTADVLLLHQKAQATETVIPSKLLSYMASGKPIVAGVHAASETARTLEATDAGVVVPPESPTALVAALVGLRGDAAEREKLGRAGRHAVATRFAREVVLRHLEEVLADAIAEHPTRRQSPS